MCYYYYYYYVIYHVTVEQRCNFGLLFIYLLVYIQSSIPDCTFHLKLIMFIINITTKTEQFYLTNIYRFENFFENYWLGIRSSTGNVTSKWWLFVYELLLLYTNDQVFSNIVYFLKITKIVIIIIIITRRLFWKAESTGLKKP